MTEASQINVANFMAKTGCTAACRLRFYNLKDNPHVNVVHRGKKIVHAKNAALENNLPYLINHLIDWHKDHV